MRTVWLLCPDAALREQLSQSLRDGEGIIVCAKPCAADAVVAVPSVLTQAQVEALQAYVDTGSVREAAKRRCCSPQTIRHHLAAARARVGARNVAQLVHIAWMLGLLTAPSSTNWLQEWQKLAIDTGGRQSRIKIENSKTRYRLLCFDEKPIVCAAGEE